MFVEKNFKISSLIQFTWVHIVWIALWATTVALLHEITHWKWMAIPWVPISVIGTAVAFYVGFKNNQAYDRLWEARKIWGAMVNTSRMWGVCVKAYVSNHFTENKLSEEEIHGIKQKLIYRHIAWLYTLRNQLLIPTQWEHVNQSGKVGKNARLRKEAYGVGLTKDGYTEKELIQLLPQNEYERLINYKNTATQIIDQQSQHLHELRTQDLIEDFRHMELQNILNEFYVHQGKAERIKKFPLPRQYGASSLIFIVIFIFLLPLGMISEFHKLGSAGFWLIIPFTVLVGWIFMLMELVGDYSENPFEGLGNDIPMLSLCRIIEIDLREMLGETDLPPNIQPIDGVLM